MNDFKKAIPNNTASINSEISKDQSIIINLFHIKR